MCQFNGRLILRHDRRNQDENEKKAIVYWNERVEKILEVNIHDEYV